MSLPQKWFKLSSLVFTYRASMDPVQVPRDDGSGWPGLGQIKWGLRKVTCTCKSHAFCCVQEV